MTGMEILALVAGLVQLGIQIPGLVKSIKALIDDLRGVEVSDLSHEEFVKGIDDAVAALPPWE